MSTEGRYGLGIVNGPEDGSYGTKACGEPSGVEESVAFQHTTRTLQQLDTASVIRLLAIFRHGKEVSRRSKRTVIQYWMIGSTIHDLHSPSYRHLASKSAQYKVFNESHGS